MSWLGFVLNPQKKLRVDVAFDGDNMVQRYTQDIQHVVDAASESRAATSGSRMGDVAHAAHIPDVTIMEMLTKHGVNFYDKNHKKAVTKLMNTEYRHLMFRDIIL